VPENDAIPEPVVVADELLDGTVRSNGIASEEPRQADPRRSPAWLCRSAMA
jgi:hypothetical protein